MDAHLLLFTTTTGYQTRMFREAAARLGVRLTLATDRCDRLEDPWGDGAIAVKFQDPHGSLSALDGAFTGIIALGDQTTFLAALHAERCGLPFHPPFGVEATRSKFLTKERFRAAGLPQPRYHSFPTGAPPADVEFPCVLKPLGMSGSRGVIRANNSREFAEAWKRISALLPAGDSFIQVESFIPGKEFAIEGLMSQGSLRILAIFDKPDPLDGPYFEETIYVTPSREASDVQSRIRAAVSRGVEALGLRHGPIHAECRVNPTGVYLLEIAARPIGGLCAKALQFEGGIGLEELIVRHALGEDVSNIPMTPEASGVMMIPIPRAGIYRGVEGAGRNVIITAKEGQLLKAFPEASSYLGFIFARANSPQEAESALRAAHLGLRFDIATELMPRR